MARKPRVEYLGAIYHLINRGDRREAIFLDDLDRRRFLETLGQSCQKTCWQVHAYCLMSNHFHLVVETPGANLCAGMHWLLGTYTARFNRRHRMVGHLISGRYKSLLVDGSSPGYLKSVCDYVHLNPVRAKILREEQPLREYRWSSFPEYLKAPGKRPPWLRVDRLLGEWGIQRDTVAGRRRFERGVEERKREEVEAENPQWKSLRRGWCWGGAAFREELLDLIGEAQAEHHNGEELLESAELEAERLIEEMVREAGWEKDQLGRRRKGDKQKVRIAAALRARTTMSWKWIAGKLHMGHWRSAANAVRLGM
jgi:putative transposase